MTYILIGAFAIIVLAAVLLSLKITVKVSYDEEAGQIRCTIGYLWLKWTVLPQEETDKRKKKKKKHKDTGEKDSALTDTLKEDGVICFLRTVKELLHSAWNLIKEVLGRATLHRFTLNLVVAGDDAAQTAIICGVASGVIYPIIGEIVDIMKDYSDLDVSIVPDYSDGTQSKINFLAELTIKPVQLISALIEGRNDADKLVSSVNNK